MLSRHFRGEGGIEELLRVSTPIIISQASVSLMMLTDRFLLTSLGLIYPAAAMSANITAHLFCMFFVGLISYITALSAQYLGAGQKKQCSLTCFQGLILAAVIYPFLLFSGEGMSISYAKWAGIFPEEQKLSFAYFRVINFSSFFLLANCALSSFFSGVGHTKIIMQTNLVGLLLNLPLSYYLIYYGPVQGIEGAAWGTSISTAAMFAIYLTRYFSRQMRQEFATHRNLYWNFDVFKKLIRFGGPTGVEYFLIFCSFSTFVQLFHSYGPAQALAITIAFNWDVIVFLFLWGLNIGLMSLVGRYQGEGKSELSLRSTYSCLKVALTTVVLFSLTLLSSSVVLAEVFLPAEIGPQIDTVLELAPMMLKTVGIYCFASALTLVFSATLRAAGDTTSCMVISLTSNGLMFLTAILAIKVYHLEPFQTWLCFVLSVFFEAGIFTFRFFQARWQSIRVV